MDSYCPIFKSHSRRALIIVNFDYEDTSTHMNLKIEIDAQNMEILLKSLFFETKILLNKSLKEVTDVYN